MTQKYQSHYTLAHSYLYGNHNLRCSLNDWTVIKNHRILEHFRDYFMWLIDHFGLDSYYIWNYIPPFSNSENWHYSGIYLARIYKNDTRLQHTAVFSCAIVFPLGNDKNFWGSLWLHLLYASKNLFGLKQILRIVLWGSESTCIADWKEVKLLHGKIYTEYKIGFEK